MQSTEEDIIQSVQAFQKELRDSEEPGDTILDVIGRSTREDAWQRLLAYFLTPARKHGYGDQILVSFLHSVERNTAIQGLDGPYDSVRVEIEKTTSKGDRIDLLLSQPEQWFLCIELKVEATEHHEQTKSYVDAQYLGGRDTSQFPPGGRNFLYVSPADAEEPVADDFETINWKHLLQRWDTVLDYHRTDQGAYPTRGIAQFAEFVAQIRKQVGEGTGSMEHFYRDTSRAKNAYEELAGTLTENLEHGVREITDSGNTQLRVRHKPARGFPCFEHGSPNRIEIDKPLWQAGRNKPTVLFEFNFHLKPHIGPGDNQHIPSVAVNLDIRGGQSLKQELREGFEALVRDERYRSSGFSRPHANSKWHFLSKEIYLTETEQPISDLLDSFCTLYQFETELDQLVTQAIDD